MFGLFHFIISRSNSSIINTTILHTLVSSCSTLALFALSNPHPPRVQDLDGFLDVVPPAARERDSDRFMAAVKSVAEATCQLMQVANQSAYLVGAAHPSSKPGRVGRLQRCDQLTTLHDLILAVRKAASELSYSTLNATPDGLPPLEVG